MAGPVFPAPRPSYWASVNDAAAQAWLEQVADAWENDGATTVDPPSGGWPSRLYFSVPLLSEHDRLARPEPMTVRFHAVLVDGRTLTTDRTAPTERAEP